MIIGGILKSIGSNARLGASEFLVAEADESDGSFLKMKPTIAIVTNIDREHLDHYDDLTEIQDTFVEFLSRLPFYGVAVVCLDDPNVRSILPRVDRKVITYGLSSEADISAVDVSIHQFESSYTVSAFGEQIGRITVALPGRHSVYNSLAAVAVAMELEIPFQTIARALKSFRGVDRRFQLRGRYNDALVVDDYGHHPTEIEAVLNGVREGFGSRTIAVFQPHRFSRTQALLEEFGGAFHLADIVFVTDIYPAGEDPVPGIDGDLVQDALVRHGHPDVRFVKDPGAIVKQLQELLQPGDVMITLGAGDVWKIGDSLAKSGKKQGRRKR